MIPGKVVMSLEIRDLASGKIDQVYRKIQDESKKIEVMTKTRITFTPLDVTAIPAPTCVLCWHTTVDCPDPCASALGPIDVPTGYPSPELVHLIARHVGLRAFLEIGHQWRVSKGLGRGRRRTLTARS